MPNLPNPFDSGAALACGPDDAAASSPQMPSGDAAADLPDDLKQRLLEAIEDDYRFVLDVQKFMSDIAYVPPAARPENFEQYMAALDALVDSDHPPLFIQQQKRA